jgi:uncharacterized protein YsxB (DUF464 family)
MIEATIKEKNGGIWSYEISGHAESGEYGHDVVCAAVSVLGITTANNLYKLAKIRPLAEMESGHLKVEIPITLSKKQSESSQFLLKAFENALEDVVEEYSQYIELKHERNNS